MDTLEKIDMMLQEILGRGMAKFLKVKDADAARKILKKKGVKFIQKDLDFTVGDDDFDTAEEALLRANILRF